MIKTIELTKSNVARLGDTEPFLLPDELVLQFNSIGYDLSTAFVSMQNGEVKTQEKLKNPLTVDKKVLIAGDLNIGIHLYKGGNLVKNWYCLPIRIAETEQGTMAFDVLSQIEKRLEALEKNSATKKQHTALLNAHNALAENHNTLAETVSEIKEKIKEL